MRTEIKRNERHLLPAAVTAILFAVLLVTTAFMLLFAPGTGTAIAEDDLMLHVHVYDSAQEYNKLGGWFWPWGGTGHEVLINADAAEDEEFKKEYTLDGTTVTNKSHLFEVALSSAELKKQPAIGMLITYLKDAAQASFWDKYDKETGDIKVDTSGLFNGKTEADLYYIRKDKVYYTNLEDAKMALEKVTVARFVSKSKVEFEATSPITSDMDVVLYDGDKPVPGCTVKAKPDSSNVFKGTATFSFTFDFGADYQIKVGNIPSPASVARTALIDEKDFITKFETKDAQEVEYGAVYTKEKTTVRLWAPLASEVKLNLYEEGAGGDASEVRLMSQREDPNTGEWAGVWETVLNGDYKNKYYNFLVTNAGATVEAMDPYAKACGVNGSRAMIIDLKSTDPEGWENDTYLYNSPKYSANADVPIVWELQVNDFSASPDSGMVNKGKFLAFTERGTTVPGTAEAGKPLKTGVDYLVDLGVTYVHLNPIYDFVSVDESIKSEINNRDLYNWGYDPQNYNIPDGSFSTDPYHGEVRINEFKQMVMALHNAGIGVIMDVVYNHTYSTSNLAVADVVPGYFYRTNANGEYSDGSGCGNETASERAMVRKYIVDSILYWATEYHLDGFRFDLMGIHDVITVNTVRDKLNKLDNNKGKKLLLYGEPWAGGGLGEYSFNKRVNATVSKIEGTGEYTSNKGDIVIDGVTYNNRFVADVNGWDNYNGRIGSALKTGIAVFNDKGRNGIRGEAREENDKDRGIKTKYPDNYGWIHTGNNDGEVKAMINGTSKGMANASQNVPYASVHDNFTLWDQVLGKYSCRETPLYYDAPMEYQMHQVETTSAVCLMSQGIPLIIAGEEMARTKYGNENSYNSPIKLNQIVWSRQAIFKDVYAHYKAVIAVRKAYASLFSYSNAVAGIKPNITMSGTNIITLTITSGGKTLKCVFNGSDYATSVSVPSGYKVYVANGKVTSTAPGTLESKCAIICGTENVTVK